MRVSKTLTNAMAMLPLTVTALVGAGAPPALAARCGVNTGASTIADFDGNGVADLAIGVPTEDVGAVENAGAVNVLYATSSGLSSAGAQLWTQDSAADGVQIEERSESFEGFGVSVAWGDFNADGCSDLAIGVPSEAFASESIRGGAVNVLYGSPGVGLTTTNNQLWNQNRLVAGSAENGDRFGEALATGDLDGDGFDDLVVGSPGEATAAGFSAGQVNVAYGSATGLTATGTQVVSQDDPEILDDAEAFDQFGGALAIGDFGRGAEQDLAVGAEGEDIGNVGGAGIVHVVYGSTNGLTGSGDQVWSQREPGVLDVEETGDAFGAALAAGNIGVGPEADLVIGVPDEDASAGQDIGAVHTLYGSVSGLESENSQFLNQATTGVGGDPQDRDRFGDALVIANFGRSGERDLAVGVPGDMVAELDGAGAVNVLFGSPAGVTGTSGQYFTQNFPGVPDDAEQGDQFGAALAASNLGKTPEADLAIGVLNEGVLGASGAGAVNVLYSDGTSLTATGSQFWTQDSPEVPDQAEESDLFGESLAQRATRALTVGPTCAGLPATKPGGRGTDKLAGTVKRDVMAGLGGDDFLSGDGGSDVLCGNGDDDVLRGGRANDLLVGGSGFDRLRGGPGVDTCLRGERLRGCERS